MSYVNPDSNGNAINIAPEIAFGAGIYLHCKLNDNGTWNSNPRSYPKIDDIPSSFQVEEVECFHIF